MDERSDARILHFCRKRLPAAALWCLAAIAQPAHGQMIAGQIVVGDPYASAYWGWSPEVDYGGPWLQPWPIILPPLYLPAETMYGPGAMQRFMGVHVPFNSPRNVVVVNRPDREDVAEGEPKLKVSNEMARARADRFMQFGDAQFAKQRYHSASERYKSATEAAPDLADPYFRQGFALIALGRYDSAARVVRRGLLLGEDISPPGFLLDELYQGNRAAKTAHLEALSQAIEAAPHTADLLLLLAMMLHYDGQPDRATPLFTRCAQLGGNDDGALNAIIAKK